MQYVVPAHQPPFREPLMVQKVADALQVGDKAEAFLAWSLTLAMVPF